MRLLIDSHVFLWYVTSDAKLTKAALESINNPLNDILVSIASVWEIGIKVSTGKLALHQPFSTVFPGQLDSNDFHLLTVTIDDVEQVSRFPFHHRDPFDRIIAAQAIVQNLQIVSADVVFDRYGATRIW